MSSLAASRADNFYHPPEWDPQKESRKKFQKAKGKNQYETDGVIRFELPMDAWCEGCDRHYGKGTRWNAKKESDGKYFSTKIWKFTMVCHSCPAKIVIATDPKNSDYDFRAGLRQKVEDKDDAGEAGSGQDAVSAGVQAQVDAQYKVGGHAAEAERARRATDRMHLLEHGADDVRRARTEGERHDVLVEAGEVRRKWDYDANACLRQGLRQKRHEAEALERERRALQLSLPLLPHSESDAHAAALALGRGGDVAGAAHPEAAAVAAAAAVARQQRRNAAASLAQKTRMLGVTSSSAFGGASLLHQRDLKAATVATAVPLLGAAAAARRKDEAWRRAAQQTGGSGGVETKVKRKRLLKGPSPRSAAKRKPSGTAPGDGSSTPPAPASCLASLAQQYESDSD